MLHNHDFQSVTSRLLSLIDELSLHCDYEFNAAYETLEREFAELRLQLGNE